VEQTLQLIPVFLLAAFSFAPCALAAAKPLRVFIPAGQSNLQGHAKVGAFEHIGMDPAAKPMLTEMQGADGKPKVCERVWISPIGCAGAEQTGRLTAGCGATSGKSGPKSTTGLYMQNYTDAPILPIKTSWGGKRLNDDVRPPSAAAKRGGVVGPYPRLCHESEVAELSRATQIN
jgi:alpha-galactosidase